MRRKKAIINHLKHFVESQKRHRYLVRNIEISSSNCFFSICFFTTQQYRIFVIHNWNKHRLDVSKWSGHCSVSVSKQVTDKKSNQIMFMQRHYSLNLFTFKLESQPKNVWIFIQKKIRLFLYEKIDTYVEDFKLKWFFANINRCAVHIVHSWHYFQYQCVFYTTIHGMGDASWMMCIAVSEMNQFHRIKMRKKKLFL